MHLILLVFMVMLQPELSLKPTTAFELWNIGLFAIRRLLLHHLRLVPGLEGEEGKAGEMVRAFTGG